MLIYIITFAIIFGVLIFLTFCAGSPVRSWKSVVVIGLPLAALLGWYFNHAFPAKSAPLPQAAKAAAYRQELERTFRRIDGVDRASFVSNHIELDFAQDKPLAELKKIAMETGGTASWFLKTNQNSVQITVHITVEDRDRYEMTLDTAKGVIEEHEF
jgi:hypothetical protein